MKAIFVRTKNGLAPADEAANRLVMRHDFGDEILLEHKRKRSAANHRRFFVFVNTTFDWQDDYENPDIWRKVLEIGGGHFTPVVDLKGNTHLWPASIAWDELDEEEFQRVFNNAVNAYLRRYGPQLSEEQVDMVARF